MKSDLKVSNIIALGLGGIGFVSLGIFIITNSFLGEYPQIGMAILGLLFFLFGIYIFIYLLNINHLQVQNGNIEVFSLFKNLRQVIPLSSIVSFSEIDKETKNSSWTELVLYTNEDVFKISSGTYSNYQELKRRITIGKNENKQAKIDWKNKLNRKYGYGFSIVGAVFLLFFGILYLQRNNVLTNDDLSQIEGTVSTKLEIKKSGKRKRTLSIPINLNEYPDFKFRLDGLRFKSTKDSLLLTNVKVGEKISISLLTKQLKKKITKEVPLSFWDKYNNYEAITIYGITDANMKYFDLHKYNELNKSDKNSGSLKLLIGFSLFLFSYGVYELVKSKKASS